MIQMYHLKASNQVLTTFCQTTILEYTLKVVGHFASWSHCAPAPPAPPARRPSTWLALFARGQQSIIGGQAGWQAGGHPTPNFTVVGWSNKTEKGRSRVIWCNFWLQQARF